MESIGDILMSKKKINGDRIVQIILLVLIAGGIALMAWIMKPKDNNPYGGYPGAPGGPRPVGGPPAAASADPGEVDDKASPEGFSDKDAEEGVPGDMPDSDTREDTDKKPADGEAPSGPPQGGGAPAWGGMPWGGGQKESAVAVETIMVSRQDVQKYIYVNGDVVSDVSVDIFSDVQGELTRLSVSLGSYVRKGDLLAVVDPSSPGAVYSVSEIPATISGTVTQINAHVGDKVGANSAILTLGDLDKLSILTYIPERYITYLEEGLQAEVEMAAFPDKVFQAEVVQLNPVMDNTSRSLEIKLDILNPDQRIRAGMFASMKLVTQERKNVLALPVTAVENYYDEKVVFVIKDDQTVERRPVITGLTTEEKVEILEGLSLGDQVVSQGLSLLADGSKVKVVNPDSRQDR